MQQSTLFSILMILLSKRKVSRDYLAERFSISKRTVSRYLAVLEDAGVPIISVAGVNGGIMLADDYTVDKTMLTEAEIIRINDALKISSEKFGDGINQAISEKLNAVQKTREQDNFVIKQSDFYIDCEFGQAENLKPKIKTLSAAINSRRVVDIKYTDARGSLSYRSIEPYTLVFKSGAWYIYAMCRLRGDFRLFKLSRISDLRLTSKSFTLVESRLVEKLGLEYYNEVYVDLEFELFPAAAVSESVVDWLGISALSDRGAKLVARAEVPLTDAVYKKLLSYGSSIKVINPPELAQKLRDEAKLMLGIYEKASDRI